MSGCEGCTGCGEGCSHPEHKAKRVVIAPDVAREVRAPLGMDEARAAVARIFVKVIGEIVAELSGGEDAPDKEPVLTAARELQASLEKMARTFERPRILRPSRSLKVL